ncbi:MAG TPA: DinB family protein [Terriglobales bacterium]|nr:DinB family protein [Terriglobales bacterium]
MTKTEKWFDRKFEFSFPMELYPNICMRLRGTPARLEELVRGREHEHMVRAAKGKWSAQEHTGHLLDLEPLWMARAEDFIAGRNELTVADLSNRKTFEAGHNQRALGEILADFRKARLKLVGRLEELNPQLFRSAIPHPRLRVPMRLVDHLFFVAEHDDHHLTMIWEMIHDRALPASQS